VCLTSLTVQTAFWNGRSGREREAAPKCQGLLSSRGAREAGGTKTYSGALVKQKTAVPRGAASLSLAVLRAMGEKGGWARQRGELGAGKRASTTQDAETLGLSQNRR
jgi:hypothetical protein